MNDEAPAPPKPATPGAWFIAAPAIALVVGLVLGGLLVWAGQGDPVTAEEDTSSPTPAPTSTAAADDTAIVVPSECLEAAETVEAATEAVRDLASALRDFRADEISELLTRLETLEGQAREQADACRAVQLSSTSVPSPTA